MTDTKLHLQEWHEMKQTIAKLTKKCDKYKKNAEKVMREKNLNILAEDGFVVERKIQQSTRMIKKNVPVDIWKEHATITRYDTFYLKKKKEKKK